MDSEASYSRHVSILTDRQEMFKAIESLVTDSGLVLDCERELFEVAKIEKLKLLWLLNHAVINGNEVAYSLVRNSLRTAFIGPEPSGGIASCVTKELIN